MKILLSLFIIPCLSVFAAIYKHSSPGFQLEYNDQMWKILPAKTGTRRAEEVDKSMFEKTCITLRRENEDSGYHALISMVQDDYERLNLKGADKVSAYYEYARDFQAAQQFQIEKSKVSNEMFLNSLKVPAYEIESFHRSFGLKSKQIIFLKEGKAYLLTLSARPQVFDGYAEEFKKVVESLRFESAVR